MDDAYMVESVQLFTALLALAALSGTLALACALITRKRSHQAKKFLEAVAPSALVLAALISVATMAGSLYFSEIANYTPCKLCWYQRIAAFSLALVLPGVAWKRDTKAALCLLPLPAAGIVVSTYHWVIEHYPNIKSSSCEITAPCTAIWFEKFGFLTLSSMAWISFATTITLIAVSLISNDSLEARPEGVETRS